MPRMVSHPSSFLSLSLLLAISMGLNIHVAYPSSGAVVGYGLLSGAACGRHLGPAYAFDPARVRVVPPTSPSGATKKRKRSDTTPSSLSSRQPSPAAARDLRTGQARQLTTSGAREAAGDASGADAGDTADETAVEASLTEVRRVVGR